MIEVTVTFTADEFVLVAKAVEAAGKSLEEWAHDAAVSAAVDRENTVKGMEALRQRRGGTLPKRGEGKDTAVKLNEARRLLARGATMTDAARGSGLSRASLYRLLGDDE